MEQKLNEVLDKIKYLNCAKNHLIPALKYMEEYYVGNLNFGDLVDAINKTMQEIQDELKELERKIDLFYSNLEVEGLIFNEDKL